MEKVKTNESKDDSHKIGAVKFLAWQSRGISVAAMTIIMGYLMIFCTDTLKMSAGIVGTILMVSKIFDVFTNYFASIIVDNTHTKWGKARPYEWCIVGLWVCTLALFYTPASWSMAVKVVWVFVMYTLVWSVFSTMLSTNQTPYMIRAFDDDIEKITKIDVYGGVAVMVGSILVSVSFPVLMGKMAVNPQGWRSLVTIYALPMLLIGILRFIFVKENPLIDASTGFEKVGFKEVLMLLKKNKYTWVAGGVAGFYNLVVGMNAGTYYFAHVMGNISLYSTVQLIGIVVLPVAFVFPKLTKKLMTSQMITYGCFISAFGYLILFVANRNLPLLMIGTIVSSAGQFPFIYLQGNIGVQLADYDEYIGLARMDSSQGIVANAFSRIGTGLGTALLGGLLGLSGYIGSAHVQSDSVIFMIRSVYSLVPMLAMLIMGIITSRFFNLDRQQKAINQMLASKREAYKNEHQIDSE